MSDHQWIKCSRIVGVSGREEVVDPQPIRLPDGNFNHMAPSWTGEDSIYYKSETEAKEVWVDDAIKELDFTGVWSLELRGCRGIHHIFSIPAAQLSQLRSLTVQLLPCEEAIHFIDHTRTLRYRLRHILAASKNLETFILYAWDMPKVLRVTTLCRFSKSLKNLSLFGCIHDGLDQLTVKDLRELQKGCPLLESMVVRLPMFPYENGAKDHYADRTSFEANEFITACCDFRRLKDLELGVSDNLGTSTKTGASTDSDYDDAMAIMKKMHEDKIGVPFDTITIDLGNAKRPSNFRPRDAEHHWTLRRVFSSKIVDGRYVQYMLGGEDRVRLAPFGLDDPQACWINTPD